MMNVMMENTVTRALQWPGRMPADALDRASLQPHPFLPEGAASEVQCTEMLQVSRQRGAQTQIAFGRQAVADDSTGAAAAR